MQRKNTFNAAFNWISSLAPLVALHKIAHVVNRISTSLMDSVSKPK